MISCRKVHIKHLALGVILLACITYALIIYWLSSLDPLQRILSSDHHTHVLAVIIPFRDRFDELLEFVPYMDKFLNAQSIKHIFYVINQVDNYRFNRASLINVGYMLSQDAADYFVMHDVDLMPLNEEISYSYPTDGIVHIAAPTYHPLYHYNKFVGGIVLLTYDHYKRMNGMSNRYWGWGKEDDEFFVRIKLAKIPLYRPARLSSNSSNTFLHMHNKYRRVRDMKRYYNQVNVSRTRDVNGGLTDLKYQVQRRYIVSINNATVLLFNVQLFCNQTVTPWCLTPGA